jgi:rhodanese-related sulfurtransferase
MKKISPAELKEWMQQDKDFLLLDVRELFERDAFNIGGMHIPLNEVIKRRQEIPDDNTVIVYCEKGIRSAIVIERLEGMGYNNLYNLSGGMSAWKKL